MRILSTRPSAVDSGSGINYVYPASSTTYAPFGGLAGMTNGNGVTFTAAYDNRLRPSTIVASVSGSNLLNLAYTYNGDSTVKQLANTNVSNYAYTDSYTYDAVNRILSATGGPNGTGYSQGFTYTADGSPNGQFGNVTCNSGTGYCPKLTFSAANNQITYNGAAAVSYDAAGDLTNDGAGYTYTWDAEGRMATAAYSGTQTASYLYDGLGERVENTVSGRRYWFGASGELLTTTDSGMNPAGWVYFAGQIIARHDGTGSGAVYYLYDDALGSERVMTDHSGNALRCSDYYPFGGEYYLGCGSGYDEFQFAGMFTTIGNTGTNYTLFRHYNSSLARWLSPDPLGGDTTDPQSLNRYSYVLNSPTNGVDPLGLDSTVCGHGAGAWAGCDITSAPDDGLGPLCALGYICYDPTSPMGCVVASGDPFPCPAIPVGGWGYVPPPIFGGGGASASSGSTGAGGTTGTAGGAAPGYVSGVQVETVGGVSSYIIRVLVLACGDNPTCIEILLGGDIFAPEVVIPAVIGGALIGVGAAKLWDYVHQPKPVPVAKPIPDAATKTGNPTIDCWNQYIEDLKACSDAYPPGPQRQNCFDKAREKLHWCLGKLPGPM